MEKNNNMEKVTTSELISKLDTDTKNLGDAGCNSRALYLILKANMASITGLIEDDSSGNWFHKAFRQMDVTPSTDIDLAIWNLLKSDTVFWKTLKYLREEPITSKAFDWGYENKISSKTGNLVEDYKQRHFINE